MTKKNLNITAAVMLCFAAGAANAQYIRPAYAYPSAPASGGPAAVQVGDLPVYATPYIGLAGGRDDNLFLSNTNAKKSYIGIVSPGLRFDARSEAAVFQLAYQGQIGRYATSHEDDYVDHTTKATVDLAFTGRAFLRVGYEYDRLHDPRGSTDRAIAAVPDKYQVSNPSGVFAFGAPGAQGRIELYASDLHKKYLNNRANTAVSDRDQPEYGGAFYWRVAPKTYVLAEARFDEIRYDLPNPASGEERRYFGGVSWEATAATTGTIKVGQLRRSFNNGSPSTSDTSWEGLITWAPRTYSTFDFYTARTTTESTGQGRFLLTTVAGVTWNHAWSSVLSSGVLYRYQKDEYQGFPRTDDTNSLGFKVGYRFRRWLTVGGEYTHYKRTSNVPINEYDRNLYMLTATASM